MASDFGLQLAILLFALGIFLALHKLPKLALTKLRSRNRTTVQSHRHFVQGAQLLSRAQSARNNKSTAHRLAQNAVDEADKAISIDPRDAASHILKAMALDLMGHKLSAIRSLDAALNPPAVRSLSEKERGDALVKRAELQVAVNRRRRVDSAVADLVEAVSLSKDNVKALCMLGQCYEMKGMREEARGAFGEAVRLDAGSVVARDALGRLGS